MLDAAPRTDTPSRANASTCSSQFTEEIYISLESTPRRNAEAESLCLIADYLQCLQDRGLVAGNALWMRFYVSDMRTQAAAIRRLCRDCAIPVMPTFIGQAPLRGGRVALEARLIRGVNASPIVAGGFRGSMMELPSGRLIFGRMVTPASGGDSKSQTRRQFTALRDSLEPLGARLDSHLLRTWIYVHDIDANYQGMSQGRNQVFSEAGLTGDTHFVASTGIQARLEEPGQLVLIDALLTPDVDPNQIEFMSAPSHMPPTHAYGVSFERGTRVLYGDRAHYYVSGTASIDADGGIMHPGDIIHQTERMVENIHALLANHSSGIEDIRQAIVYLRNPQDAIPAEAALRRLLPETVPYLMVHGPVCRPGWLIEMEAVAVNAAGDDRFPAFLQASHIGQTASH